MIKKDVECGSRDKHLGNFPTVEKCAEACKKFDGCKFFVYGKGPQRGECFYEFTKSADCPEGFRKGHYDFYSNNPADEKKKEETT